jgi:hypothetical protein
LKTPARPAKQHTNISTHVTIQFFLLHSGKTKAEANPSRISGTFSTPDGVVVIESGGIIVDGDERGR